MSYKPTRTLEQEGDNKDFEQAIADGTATRGTLTKRFGLKANVVFLKQGDAAWPKSKQSEKELPMTNIFRVDPQSAAERRPSFRL